MEILSKLLISCLLFVNALKNSDGGIIERLHERNKIRRAKLLPFLKPNSQFQQQNDYNDYGAGVDANYEDYQDNGYSQSGGIVNPDVTYNVPNNPNVERYNGNIQNQQTNYKAGQMPDFGQPEMNTFFPVNNNIRGGTGATSEDYNNNLNIPRPKVSNEFDTISDRFGGDATSTVGEREKKKVIPVLKLLKPLTKTIFFFQVQPVKPEVDRTSGNNIVYYIE